MKNVLYIHGMGGGGDSRIPGLLRTMLNGDPREVNVVVRTYDFNPDVAWGQITLWLEELKPVLVIGESLGANNALKIKGVPHILVSPSLNAPLYLGLLSPLALIPGVKQLLGKAFKPRPGDRQRLDFSFGTLRRYLRLRRKALECAPGRNDVAVGGRESKDSAGMTVDGFPVYAFFGSHDHYRRSGIVAVRTWTRHFGNGCHSIYDGTHYMEEKYVRSLLLPKIFEFLGIS